MARCLSAGTFIEVILEAARLHGQESEPDMEVGDLQELARALWKILTPKQRQQITSDETYVDLVATWGG